MGGSELRWLAWAILVIGAIVMFSPRGFSMWWIFGLIWILLMVVRRLNRQNSTSMEDWAEDNLPQRKRKHGEYAEAPKRKREFVETIDGELLEVQEPPKSKGVMIDN